MAAHAGLSVICMQRKLPLPLFNYLKTYLSLNFHTFAVDYLSATENAEAGRMDIQSEYVWFHHRMLVNISCTCTLSKAPCNVN